MELFQVLTAVVVGAVTATPHLMVCTMAQAVAVQVSGVVGVRLEIFQQAVVLLVIVLMMQLLTQVAVEVAQVLVALLVLVVQVLLLLSMRFKEITYGTFCRS
jgi:hypothetical protein